MCLPGTASIMLKVAAAASYQNCTEKALDMYSSTGIGSILTFKKHTHRLELLSQAHHCDPVNPIICIVIYHRLMSEKGPILMTTSSGWH